MRKIKYVYYNMCILVSRCWIFHIHQNPFFWSTETEAGLKKGKEERKRGKILARGVSGEKSINILVYGLILDSI